MLVSFMALHIVTFMRYDATDFAVDGHITCQLWSEIFFIFWERCSATAKERRYEEAIEIIEDNVKQSKEQRNLHFWVFRIF